MANQFEAVRTVSGIKKFVASGKKFTDEQNKDGMTPSHLVALNGSARIFKAFYQAEGRFSQKPDIHGNAPGHIIAGRAGEKGIIKAYADAEGKFPDTQNKGGFTPGHLVAEQGNAESIKAFVAVGGKFSKKKNYLGKNAGDYAAKLLIVTPDKLKAYLEVGGPLPTTEQGLRVVLTLASKNILRRVANSVAQDLYKSSRRPKASAANSDLDTLQS